MFPGKGLIICAPEIDLEVLLMEEAVKIVVGG